jgi:hypothetical protein
MLQALHRVTSLHSLLLYSELESLSCCDSLQFHLPLLPHVHLLCSPTQFREFLRPHTRIPSALHAIRLCGPADPADNGAESGGVSAAVLLHHPYLIHAEPGQGNAFPDHHEIPHAVLLPLLSRLAEH